MGAEQSQSGDGTDTDISASSIINQVRGGMNSLRATLVSYDQLCDSIDQLNILTSQYKDHQDRHVMFKIKKGTDDSIFWRATIRIHCIKIIGERPSAIEISSRRLLTLRQFINLRNAIASQIANISAESQVASATPPVGFDVSVIMNKCDSIGGEIDEVDSDNQCCICMERPVDVVLSCAHEYCLPCIEQWSYSSKTGTCPECRRIMKLDDSLVVLDKPGEGELKAELTNYLSAITDQT